MLKVLFVLFIFILISIGLLFLQIYLSKKENKWLGVFIPVLSFCSATLFAIFNGSSLGIFVVLNIPTVIYFVVYAACREKLKIKKSELAKINIQDLNWYFLSVSFKKIYCHIPRKVV